MPVPADTRKDLIRYAPGYGPSPLAGNVPSVPYTVDALARFLGEVKHRGEAHKGFHAMFGALELLSEGYLTEAVPKCALGGRKLCGDGCTLSRSVRAHRGDPMVPKVAPDSSAVNCARWRAILMHCRGQNPDAGIGHNLGRNPVGAKCADAVEHFCRTRAPCPEIPYLLV